MFLNLIGAAFFLQYAFDNNWIGQQGQVCIGLFARLGLCVAGDRQYSREMCLFGQLFTSAGVVLLSLCSYATFGFFHLLSPIEVSLKTPQENPIYQPESNSGPNAGNA